MLRLWSECGARTGPLYHPMLIWLACTQSRSQEHTPNQLMCFLSLQAGDSKLGSALCLFCWYKLLVPRPTVRSGGIATVQSREAERLLHLRHRRCSLSHQIGDGENMFARAMGQLYKRVRSQH
jgi:hypothetical protein